MAENTDIAWAHHTVNWWIGCSKVSPACANCYAERLADRFWPGNWGDSAPRMLRVDAARREAMRYERRAIKEGVRFRVFTNSLSDFFEDRRDLDAGRLVALETMRLTPHLDWMILTKRPEKVADLLKAAWRSCTGPLALWLRLWAFNDEPPANVWLGTTVEDQERADLRIPSLLAVPAAVRFLSCEPMLGPVELDHWLKICKHWEQKNSLGCAPWHPPYPKHWYERQRLVLVGWSSPIHWVIAGGESGPHARPIHPDWGRSLRDQCAAAGVPFLFKQWGEWAPAMGDLWWHSLDGCPQFQTRAGSNGTHAFGDGYGAVRIGKKAAGRLLDGVLHDEFPR